MLPCASYSLLGIPAPLILDPELRPVSNPTLSVSYQYFCPAFPLTTGIPLQRVQPETSKEVQEAGHATAADVHTENIL